MRRSGKSIWSLALILMGIGWLAAGAANNREPPYFAKAESVPEWAWPAGFRFIRIDGGRIESMKAERTWWGKEFSAEEKDVLAHVYDRHFDRMLALLKAADFNWIWVTWSNGWSMQEESENREQIKTVIARGHENHVRVTAYMSATNMFWQSAFRDDPETIQYGLFMYGLPIFYAGATKTMVQVNFQRRLADVRFPGWRAYLKKKAELAMDAGVDAIFFDNIIGDTGGMKLLLSEVQRLAEQKAAASGRPKVLVYANVHLAPYRFEINDTCDLVWEEAGKDNPGVWDGQWQVDNVRKIKFLAAEKQAWQPLMFENDVNHCGARERCIPDPITQKLSIAEAYSFGAAYSRNIEGRFLHDLITDAAPAREAWAAIAQYNRFLAQHRELYLGVIPATRIALLSDSEKSPAADFFIRHNLMFETKVLKRLDQGQPLNSFRVLVIPKNLAAAIKPDQKKILNAFATSGGKIVALEPDQTLLDRLNQAASAPLLTLENSGYIVANLVKKSDRNFFILHLVNYDHDRSVPNLRIRLDLAPFLPDASVLQLQPLSPDAIPPVISNLAADGPNLSFNLSPVTHYAVVVITKRQ